MRINEDGQSTAGGEDERRGGCVVALEVRYEAEEAVGRGRKEGILMRVEVGVVLIGPR